MSTEVLSGPLGEVRAASTAGGGTALSTTAATIVLPLGTKQMTLIPRNFSTAVVAQFLKNPWLTVLQVVDAFATETSIYPLDPSVPNLLRSINTFASGKVLYVGSHRPFGGVAVAIGSAQGNASVLTVKYWNGAWTSISATDGTASGGKTLAVTGNVTWTMPTDWATTRLFGLDDTTFPIGVAKEELFWTRWEASNATDFPIVNSFIAISRSTVYAEIPSGQTWQEAVTVGPGGISSITAKTDAGTANLIVNCAARGRFAS